MIAFSCRKEPRKSQTGFQHSVHLFWPYSYTKDFLFLQSQQEIAFGFQSFPCIKSSCSSLLKMRNKNSRGNGLVFAAQLYTDISLKVATFPSLTVTRCGRQVRSREACHSRFQENVCHVSQGTVLRNAKPRVFYE